MGGCDGSGLGSWVVMAVLLGGHACLTREGMTTRRSGFVGGKKLPSETVGAAMLGKREGGQPCGLGQYGVSLGVGIVALGLVGWRAFYGLSIGLSTLTA